MDTSKSTFDPYAAPAVSDFSLHNEADGLTQDHHKLLKDFRSQSLPLGVLWLLFATVLGLVAFLLIFSRSLSYSSGITAAVLALFPIAFSTGGIGTILKRSWGIYIGLAATYMALLGSILIMNVCGLFLIIAVLIQGHRIIKLMKALRTAGIPLSTKLQVARPGSTT